MRVFGCGKSTRQWVENPPQPTVGQTIAFRGLSLYNAYFTLMVAALLAWPPQVTTSGLLPLFTPEGTETLA